MDPITKAQWADYKGKQRWDVLVALRGPDLKGSEVLKWFTTAVIRHRMSTAERVGGTVNHQLGFVVIPSGYGYSYDSNSKFDASHFLEHVHVAANHLGIPVVGVPNDLFKSLVEASSISTAIKKLLKWEGMVNYPEAQAELKSQVPSEEP